MDASDTAKVLSLLECVLLTNLELRHWSFPALYDGLTSISI